METVETDVQCINCGKKFKSNKVISMERSGGAGLITGVCVCKRCQNEHFKKVARVLSREAQERDSRTMAVHSRGERDLYEH